MARRLNIGLFIDELDNNFTLKVCQGAELGAQAIDANLYLFPGKYLDFPETTDEKLRFEYQYNIAFEYANEKNLDLLFVMLGGIGCHTHFEKQKQFLDRFSPIPVATLFAKMDGYASVTFNNRIGFEQEICHLIDNHNIKKLGLVSGPMTNLDAAERYEVFRSVLEDKGIPFSEDMVVYGDFRENSDDCVRMLMKRNPDLEAVVFANDVMAIGGYRVFKEMGLEIGRDILVAGFDNFKEAFTMSPPLTTVDANPIELTYRAVLRARDFLETGRLEDVEVDTHFVRRQSCGCKAFDYDSMAERLALTDFVHREAMDVEGINQYLFGGYFAVEELLRIKDNLAVFLKLLFEAVKGRKLLEYETDLLLIFNQIIKQPLLQYTHTERFFNVLTSLQYECSSLLETERDKMALMSIFSQIYRSLAIQCLQMVQGQQEQIAHMINTMTGDIFVLESEEKISYDLALAKLPNLGIRGVYLYTFQDMVKHIKGDIWEMPQTVMLKALSDEKGARAIPLEKQQLRTEMLLNNAFIPTNRRKTMVISPLFSGEEQYGVLVTDLSYECLNVVAPVASQLSAALKSLHLIEKQQFVQKQLEQSIEKFKESNDFLNEISRSDELTGLYNRRGFLEYVHAAIINKRNMGRKALVAYADMDNLKMINDNYGHDEGDFALREIAGILKDAFCSTDIVARFGGDEFVAFSMVDVENYENYDNIMKQRIAEITIGHNEAVNKPYPIEMSVGIWEFECSPEVDLYEILDIADERLYEEKREKKKKNGFYR